MTELQTLQALSHHGARAPGVEFMNKAQDASDKATHYANMASEMRRLALEVKGWAAQHVCTTMAEQYDALAKGVQMKKIQQ